MFGILTLKPIPNERWYVAGSDGVIYSLRSGKLLALKPFMKKPMRPAVCVGENKVAYVHILVCSAFHGPRPEGKEVRHLDDYGLNNRPSNLCWGTREENIDDIVRLGRKRGVVLRRVSQEERNFVLRSTLTNAEISRRINLSVETIRKIKREGCVHA
jgi:hypothetical protein